MALKAKFETNGSLYNSLNGTLPKGALIDPKSEAIALNDTFSKGRYQDYVLDTDKAIDMTGASQFKTQG